MLCGISKGPQSVCTECDCLKNSIPCRKCLRVNLKCAGNCTCCDRSQKSKITIDEKVLDYIIRNSVITPIKCNNKPVLLLPWEIYNKLSKPSAQQPPVLKKMVLRKPPSRAVPTPPNTGLRSILCTQCFCEADEIPCEICSFKDTYCRGSCPCCNTRAKQKLLEPHARNIYDPICPRCTCTPGEGLCHFCRKSAEESAEALARLKEKGKLRRTKPAILQHKRKSVGNSSTEQVIKVEKSGLPKVDNQNKRRESSLQNHRDILDEYCLHCDCTRGSEPCIKCKRVPCYGECVCCPTFNEQVNKEKSKENKSPEDRIFRERVEFLENFSKDDPPINSLASTSGASPSTSSNPGTKCEKCNCYRGFFKSESCSQCDMGCIFTEDSNLCLCCTLKLV